MSLELGALGVGLSVLLVDSDVIVVLGTYFAATSTYDLTTHVVSSPEVAADHLFELS